MHNYKTYKIQGVPDVKGDLEKLALEKMKCTTMACIDSIEIQEKSIGWNDGGVRTLNGIRGNSKSQAALSPGIGFVVPAKITEETCLPKEDDGKGDAYQKLNAKEIAAIAAAGNGAFAGAALKEYEDMPVAPGGEGWPGVDASSRKDTMDVSKGTLMWRNRV